MGFIDKNFRERVIKDAIDDNAERKKHEQRAADDFCTDENLSILCERVQDETRRLYVRNSAPIERVTAITPTAEFQHITQSNICLNALTEALRSREPKVANVELIYTKPYTYEESGDPHSIIRVTFDPPLC